MDKAPDAYRTISEVGEDLDLPQHVLRFWETRFPQIKPLKRGGGRRYYRPDDVELLKGIRHLLYKEGYTIKGVQRILKEQGARAVMAWARPAEIEPEPVINASMPTPLAPPPAYAPAPPPLAHGMVHGTVLAPAAVQPGYSAAPAPAFVPVAPMPELPHSMAPPPAFDLPRLELPPLDPAPLQDVMAHEDWSQQEPPLALLEPSPVEPELPLRATPPVGQVSMFRGGLQRAEAPQEPAFIAAPGSVSFNSSAYMAPAVPAPGQARTLLVQALEELSGARVTLDRLLAGCIGQNA